MSPVTSTVHIVVPVVLPPTTGVGSSSLLNWVYAGTDVTFTNSLSVGSPVYATRDLTRTNTTTIRGVAGKVVAGRNLILENPQNQIGLVGAGDPRLPEIHVVGRCSSKATDLHVRADDRRPGRGQVFATVADGRSRPA
jgi:hypothetical protein